MAHVGETVQVGDEWIGGWVGRWVGEQINGWLVGRQMDERLGG